MKKSLLLLVAITAVLSGPAVGTTLAERVYITDSFKVTCRSGPSTDHKIIRMLDSGKPLEALRSESGWTLIRIPSSAGDTIEGWVLERYLMSRVPWKNQAEALRAENESLKKKLASIEGDWEGVKESAEQRMNELATTQAELEKLRQEYESLKSGASEYLELKEQYSNMKAEFEANMEKLQNLSEENRVLRSMERTKWFATGAAVLVCGLVIGLIFGRREKKRRSSYL
ncbi:MAG: TIGR04211 family SH3 domain-containing protein [Desulfatiglandaceae bacterium]